MNSRPPIELIVRAISAPVMVNMIVWSSIGVAMSAASAPVVAAVTPMNHRPSLLDTMCLCPSSYLLLVRRALTLTLFFRDLDPHAPLFSDPPPLR